MKTRPRVVVLAIAAIVPAIALTMTGVAAFAEPRKAAVSPGPKTTFKRDWTYARDDAQWSALRKLIGKPAPALSVGAWIGEAPPALPALKGKLVLIDFWATWCGPCRAAVPHTNELASKYKNKGVVVLGVCCTEEGAGGTMTDVARKLDMKYPTAQDEANASAKAWGVKWWPFYVIVDREGIVRMAGLRPDKLEEALDSMLAEQPAK